MDSQKYQKKVLKVRASAENKGLNDISIDLIIDLLGLSEEAGEVLGKFKKNIRDKNGVLSDSDKIELKKELGDIMWYLTDIANILGYDLSDIMETNIDKLEDRIKRGVINGSGDNR